VQLKILKIKSKDLNEDLKLMVQIIDVSHRMLYKEIKAEQNLLTLVNATVSHEL